MKLSNKVLIVFFSVLFLYMVSAFSEIRFRGTPNDISDSDAQTETLEVANFSHLSVDTLRVTVVPSNTTKIELRSLSGGHVRDLLYDLEGDTLKLSDFTNEKTERIGITVYVSPRSFKSLSAHDASVYVKSLTLDSLQLNQYSGSITFDEKSTIARINSTLTGNGQLNFMGKRIATFDTTMDNFSVNLNGGAKQITGQMKNDSYLRANNVEDLDFRKDNSSQLYVN